MNKTYIYMILITLLSLGAVSCTDGNDWDVDGSQNGVFRPMDLAIAPADFSATLTWKSGKDAKYVIVEVNKKQFTGEESSANSLVFGEDKSLTKSPAVIEGLEEDTEYYIRIRGVGDDGVSSKWGYPKEDNLTFKTKIEQIFVGAPAVTSSSVKLSWEKSAEATHIVLVWKEAGVQKERKIELTDADKSAATIEIAELKENTSYTVSIYNVEKERGRLNFKTFPKTPGLGTPYFLDGTENLAEFVAALPDKAVELIIPAGASYDLFEVDFVIPTTLEHLTFWGLSGDEGQPSLKLKEIKLQEQANFRLHIFNMDVTGKNSGYLLNDNPSARSISDIIIEASKVSTFRGMVRLRGKATLNSFQIRSSIITDISNYGVLNLDGVLPAPVQEVIFENSTFYNFAADASHFSTFKTKANDITIKNCTFYDVMLAKNRYFLNFDEKIPNKPDNLLLENNIFSASVALGESEKGEGVRASNPAITTPFVFDSYRTSEFVINNSYPFEGMEDYSGKSTTLFKDPANGDFTIIDAGFTYNAGDPRWRTN